MNPQENFGSGSGGVLPGYWKGGLGDRSGEELLVGLKKDSGRDYEEEVRTLLEEVILNWMTTNTNWIQLRIYWYVIQANLSKLLKISSASNSPIHATERIEADLFETNNMGGAPENPITQSATVAEEPE